MARFTPESLAQFSPESVAQFAPELPVGCEIFNFVGFLEDTLSVFVDKKVGLVRLDSGFFSKDILDHLEQKQLKYIVAAKFTHPIQHLIDKQEFWIDVDDGIEICDKQHQANSLNKLRNTCYWSKK